MITYSICIPHYNMCDTIRESLESIFSQIDDSFEIIVCDNFSTDGSAEILKEYAEKGKLQLIQAKSTRGRGRQIAYEHSVGKYIIKGIDMDDIYNPTLKQVLNLYHAEHEGFMLTYGTIAIIPRDFVELVGGWSDLPAFEDIQFAAKVEKLGRLHYYPDSALLVKHKGTRRGFRKRLREACLEIQAEKRIGVSFNNSISYKILKLLYVFFCHRES